VSQPFWTAIKAGVAEVVIENPPVNSLDSKGWRALSQTIDRLNADESVRVIIVRAEGRGFCAGVDIKELQAHPDRIIEVNAGNYETFRALHRGLKPAIAAVHGYVLGGGIGICGSVDIILASPDARFGVPEVDRGALGAATPLARLVPPHLMRTLYFTGRTISATDLVPHGSVLEVVPRDRLDEAALAVAGEIAAKDTRVIRAAKEALNGIDPVDVNKSYRFEQGFTFELNLSGVSDELRDDFAGTEKSKK